MTALLSLIALLVSGWYFGSYMWAWVDEPGWKPTPEQAKGMLTTGLISILLITVRAIA